MSFLLYKTVSSIRYVRDFTLEQLKRCSFVFTYANTYLNILIYTYTYSYISIHTGRDVLRILEKFRISIKGGRRTPCRYDDNVEPRSASILDYDQEFEQSVVLSRKCNNKNCQMCWIPSSPQNGIETTGMEIFLQQLSTHQAEGQMT